MSAFGKFLVGAAVTIVMATLFHGPFGFGDRLLFHLGSEASRRVADLPGVTAEMATEGWQRRGVIISGAATAQERAAKIALIAAIPGIAWVRWDDTNRVRPIAAR